MPALSTALRINRSSLSPIISQPASQGGARAAIRQLLDRAEVTEVAPQPLRLEPLRDAGLPVTNEVSFAQRVETLADHRRRVAGYAAESK